MAHHSSYQEIAKVFDALVLRRVSGQDFQILHDVPLWYPGFQDSLNSVVVPRDLLCRSFFLQSFLREADSFWQSLEPGHVRSGLWCEPDVFGKDLMLEATAMTQGQDQLLIVQRFTSEMLPLQSVLQKAREASLLHEQYAKTWEDAKIRLRARLQKSEQFREDLTIMLDCLQLGSVMIDARGTVVYASRQARELFNLNGLLLSGQTLKEVLSMKTTEWNELVALQRIPEHERTPLTVTCKHPGTPTRKLEIDIQDDPRDSSGKIFFLREVSVEDGLFGLSEGTRSNFQELIGASAEMQAIYKKIIDIAQVEVPALIQGETGTGKELVARALHQMSPRGNHAFVAVNCAGLTDSLLGSQLFGHRRGAFTGATHDQEGFFEAAEGGTLFLDEIGDMPLSVQTILLRALQESEIVRLGESRPRRVDVRVIAATNQDLQELAEKGRFRSDLLYRIRVARLDLPPLRERHGDIPLLSQFFFDQARVRMRKSGIRKISPEAMQCLLTYEWPGNVRELKSSLDHAVIHCSGEAVHSENLPPEVREAGEEGCLGTSMLEKERECILEALHKTQGKRSEAAKILGMSRSTLYRRLRELEISVDHQSS